MRWENRQLKSKRAHSFPSCFKDKKALTSDSVRLILACPLGTFHPLLPQLFSLVQNPHGQIALRQLDVGGADISATLVGIGLLQNQKGLYQMRYSLVVPLVPQMKRNQSSQREKTKGR